MQQSYTTKSTWNQTAIKAILFVIPNIKFRCILYILFMSAIKSKTDVLFWLLTRVVLLGELNM